MVRDKRVKTCGVSKIVCTRTWYFEVLFFVWDSSFPRVVHSRELLAFVWTIASCSRDICEFILGMYGCCFLSCAMFCFINHALNLYCTGSVPFRPSPSFLCLIFLSDTSCMHHLLAAIAAQSSSFTLSSHGRAPCCLSNFVALPPLAMIV